MKPSALIFMFFALQSWAENLNKILECQKTLTSTVVDQYRPSSGYFICDGSTKLCYMTYTDGSSYQAKMTARPTYVANEIVYDLASMRQKYEHRLTLIEEPKSKQKEYIDIFNGENNRAFGRNLSNVNPSHFEQIKLEKSEPTLIEALAKKSIDVQFEIIKTNVEKKSGPWDMKANKESWLKRISGCGFDPRSEEIKKAVALIKD